MAAAHASTGAAAPLLVTFVTGNANKLREVQQILSSGSSSSSSSSSSSGAPSPAFELVSQALDVPEIQGTIEEVATAKCLSASAQLFGPSSSSSAAEPQPRRRRAVITEDTALVFSAFDGKLPGPYIKDFLGTLGHDGLNRMLAGFDDKRAEAVCTFALRFEEQEHDDQQPSGPAASPGTDKEKEGEGKVHIFEGRTQGRIVPARGPTNFGWDPIFEVDGAGQTYAEMESSAKNALSHRYRALDKLRAFLQQQAASS